MAMPIKTRILLPRDTFVNWENSDRVLLSGELVLAYDSTGKFRLFEGRGVPFGIGACGVGEIALDAAQIQLSGDIYTSVQAAIDDLESKTASALTAVSEPRLGVVTGLSADGQNIDVQYTDLSGRYHAVSGNAIAGLEYDHTGQITSIAEISVIRASDFGARYDQDARKMYLSAAGNVMEADMSAVLDRVHDGQITPNLLSADAEWIFDCNM